MSDPLRKEKNRAYYLKNRDTILAKARDRNCRKAQDGLSLLSSLPNKKAKAEIESFRPCSVETSFIKFQSGDFQMPENVNVVWLFANDEDKEKSSSNEVTTTAVMGTKSGLIWPFFLSFLFRLLLVGSINILLIHMQVEFYKKHEILPQFAWAMAVISETSFLSLVSMKFKGRMDWLRTIAFMSYFLYFVASFSFHVFAENQSRIAATLKNSVAANKASTASELRDMKESLKIAEKGRSWKNMEIFGSQVSRLQSLMFAEIPNTPLGISIEITAWGQILLLIFIRALLMLAEALNMIRLREQFAALRTMPGSNDRIASGGRR